MGVLGETLNSGVGKIVVFANIGALAIAILEILLAFVQSTHIIGFIAGLVLGGLALTTVILAIRFSSAGLIDVNKTILFLVTGIVGVLSLFVGICLFLKLIGFITSPDYEGRVSLVNLEDGFTSEGIMIGNENIVFTPFKFTNSTNSLESELKTFSECLAGGASNRLQTFTESGKIVVHVNHAEQFLGTITDFGLAVVGATQGSWCQGRISHSDVNLSDCSDYFNGDDCGNGIEFGTKPSQEPQVFEDESQDIEKVSM
jgi:hypothetical protein